MRLFSLLWLVCLLSLGASADPARLSVRLAVYNPEKGPVRMVMRVENLSGAEVTLQQASGQAYDFAVYDGQKELWKYSTKAFFIQAIQQRVLAPGEILSFSEDWDRRDGQGNLVPPGKYTVKGWVPTAEGPIKSEPRTLVIGR